MAKEAMRSPHTTEGDETRRTGTGRPPPSGRNPFSLAGRRALVSGASRGIGLGVALAMADAGASVALISRDPAALAAACDRITDRGGAAAAYPGDLTDVDGIDQLYRRVRADGPVDILVNNAGSTRRGPAESISAADWHYVLDLNLTSVFRLTQAFGRDRIAHLNGEPAPAGSAKVINIASLLSEQARAQNAPYAATKGAIRQLTKALAVDWARYGINVNAIGPGYIKTEMTRPLWEDDRFDAWVRERAPLGTWGTPADIGTAAVFLASPAANYVTGQVLYVDGGWLSSL